MNSVFGQKACVKDTSKDLGEDTWFLKGTLLIL